MLSNLNWIVDHWKNAQELKEGIMYITAGYLKRNDKAVIEVCDSIINECENCGGYIP